MASQEADAARKAGSKEGKNLAHPQDCSHRRGRHRAGGDLGRPRGARSLRRARRRLCVRRRALRLGLGLLQEERHHDAPRRPRAAAEVRRHLLRRGRRARRARPHHALGPAPRDLPAARPIRQRPADPGAAGHRQPAAQGRREGARLGHRPRELRGRVRRPGWPVASRAAARGRDRGRHLHPHRRHPDHALRLRARPLAAAQAPDRRHQVECAALRHGDVGRDRRRGGARTSPTSPGTRCWSTR